MAALAVPISDPLSIHHIGFVLGSNANPPHFDHIDVASQLVVVGASTRLCKVWTSPLPSGALASDDDELPAMVQEDHPLPLDMHLDNTQPLFVTVRIVDMAGAPPPSVVRAKKREAAEAEAKRHSQAEADTAHLARDLGLFASMIFLAAFTRGQPPQAAAVET